MCATACATRPKCCLFGLQALPPCNACFFKRQCLFVRCGSSELVGLAAGVRSKPGVEIQRLTTLHFSCNFEVGGAALDGYEFGGAFRIAQGLRLMRQRTLCVRLDSRQCQRLGLGDFVGTMATDGTAPCIKLLPASADFGSALLGQACFCDVVFGRRSIQRSCSIGDGA